jgi:hypothetical protein
MPLLRRQCRALPRRERPRRLRAARNIGAERSAHRERASDNGPRPPARHGQNDRVLATGRKNYLFAGSDTGGCRAAAIYSLIESAKLSGLNPQHYLADVLARIADHPARRIVELPPWNWQPLEATRAAA